MAVNSRDSRSGFCHSEVVAFINEEVLNNGGGPDFYQAFRSRPWNEVEDQLRTIVVDQQVPRATKRACAWSALALSVRVAARQREHQGRRIRRLQRQVEERESAAWALASELQHLREEHKEMVSQLRCAQDDLQQALNERDMLRGHLLQADISSQAAPPAQEVVPWQQTQQPGALAWSLDAGEYDRVASVVAQGNVNAGSQMAVPAGVLYMPAPPIPWAPIVPPSLLVPPSHPFPFPVSYPMAFPYSTPLPPTVAEAAAVAPQMPIGVTYPPDPCAAVQSQEEMDEMEDHEGPHPVNVSEQSWSQGGPRKQPPQEEMTNQPKGEETSLDAEEASLPRCESS
ncbi:testis-expressed protein 13D-like [Tamandua tetradactyla]|uniref:testis-expressed protein 13D-like n=1 Tax=Tamandua tetradactyla TaxID=48850 RepID=UPI004053F4B7